MRVHPLPDTVEISPLEKVVTLKVSWSEVKPCNELIKTSGRQLKMQRWMRYLSLDLSSSNRIKLNKVFLRPPCQRYSVERSDPQYVPKTDQVSQFHHPYQTNVTGTVVPLMYSTTLKLVAEGEDSIRCYLLPLTELILLTFLHLVSRFTQHTSARP